MNSKRILAQIRDDLDSHQIAVQFTETPTGIAIKAHDYASAMIAKKELQRRGIMVGSISLPIRC